MPHLDVPDIRAIDWQALKACKSAFGDSIVVYSNSAGLAQFDPQGAEAAEVGDALGLHVLRHTEKKPAGGAEEVERHFGCTAKELVMIGDRYFTDVVFGNRHGMLTICPEPITLDGEPQAVRLVRGFEKRTVTAWRRGGALAPAHPLASTQQALAALYVPHDDVAGTQNTDCPDG